MPDAWCWSLWSLWSRAGWWGHWSCAHSVSGGNRDRQSRLRSAVTKAPALTSSELVATEITSVAGFPPYWLADFIFFDAPPPTSLSLPLDAEDSEELLSGLRLTSRVGAPSRKCPRVGAPSGSATEWTHQHLGGAGNWSCTGEAKWCPEASSRGDAKQPRRCAGRRAGAHRRGKGPPTSSDKFNGSVPRGCTAFMVAIRGNRVLLEPNFREAAPLGSPEQLALLDRAR
jgi:hypothetical protein